jgi:CotS family spore coat protein
MEAKALEVFEVAKLANFNYDVDVINVIKIKNVYRLECREGDFCLKVVHYEFGHFLFILQAIKHLIANGFVNVPQIICSKTGADYISFGDQYAYLTPWVTARECNYDNPLDLLLASSTLANLHKKSENYTITKDMVPRYNWSKWIEVFNTRLEEILDFKMKIEEKSKKTEFDFKYIKMINNEIKRGEKSIDNLKSTNYLEKMKEEIKKNGFCHHDYAHHNVLINKTGEVTVIDFDYCILDTHLHDLSSLLIRRMKNGKWDLKSAIYILNIYDSIYKVFKDDIAIMAAFVEFPQEFWQIGIQYYWEKQPWEEENFINRLNRIELDRNERQEFVEEFRNLKYGDY